MSLFPIVTETMLSRAINSRKGKSNVVQTQIKHSMNQLADITDEQYIASLQARIERAGVPDLRLEIQAGGGARAFPFRVAAKDRDTWVNGFGATLESAVTNLRAHLPSAAEQARSDREMAAALLERAAKAEAEASK